MPPLTTPVALERAAARLNANADLAEKSEGEAAAEVAKSLRELADVCKKAAVTLRHVEDVEVDAAEAVELIVEPMIDADEGNRWDIALRCRQITVDITADLFPREFSRLVRCPKTNAVVRCDFAIRNTHRAIIEKGWSERPADRAVYAVRISESTVENEPPRQVAAV